jgi:hypothetical protein
MRGGRTSNPPPRRNSPTPQKPGAPPKPGDAAKGGSLFGRLFKKP